MIRLGICQSKMYENGITWDVFHVCLKLNLILTGVEPLERDVCLSFMRETPEERYSHSVPTTYIDEITVQRTIKPL